MSQPNTRTHKPCLSVSLKARRCQHKGGRLCRQCVHDTVTLNSLFHGLLLSQTKTLQHTYTQADINTHFLITCLFFIWIMYVKMHRSFVFKHVRMLFIRTWFYSSRFPTILLFGCLSTVHGEILGVLVLMIGLNASEIHSSTCHE